MSGDPIHRLGEIWGEVKRRGVVRVALVYLAVAFVILQAAELLVPLLLLPAVVTRAVLALLILGFPVALVVGWAYDLTPEGVQRTRPEWEGQEGPDESAAGAPGDGAGGRPERTNRPAWLPGSTLLIAGSLVALAVGLWWVTPRLDLRGGATRFGPDAPAARSTSAGARLLVNAPPGTRLTGDPFDVAISPDGGLIVFAASDGDSTHLYQRRIDEFEARRIPGATGGVPFISPDGASVGYLHAGRIWTVPLVGGSPRSVAEVVTEFGGATWGRDGTIVYADRQLGLFRIPEGGGEPVRLRGIERGGTTLGDPAWLEEGRTLLVTQSRPGGGRYRVLAVSLEEGDEEVLLEEGHDPRYLASEGILLYQLAGELFARELEARGPLDPGPPSRVVSGLARSPSGRSHAAVADDGTVVYLPDPGVRLRSRLVWVDTAGGKEAVPLPGEPGLGPRVSPGGGRIVFTRRPEGEDRVEVWIYETESGHLRRVTRDQGDNWWPIWAPDGERIVHNSNRASLGEPGSGLDLFETPLGPDREPRLLAETAGSIQPQSWSPDGSVLVFQDNTIDDAVEGEETLRDIWLLSFRETGPVRRPFLRTRFDELHPAVSPDGRWMAYVSDESGEWEVYVTAFPDRGRVRRASTGGGVGPIWGPSGEALYFRSPDGDRVYRTSVGSSDADAGDAAVPALGEPRLAFEGSFRSERPWGRNYDLHPAGDRFLMIEDVAADTGTARPRSLRVLMNALPEIRARLDGSGG